MKINITDQQFISDLKEKTSLWIEQQSKGGSGLSSAYVIGEVSEFTVYRVTLKVMTQSRRFTVFSKPGKALTGLQPGETRAEITDPWSVELEQSKEYKNGTDVIDMPATFASVRCAKCGGSGQLPCPECQEQKTVYCLQCRGDGKLGCEKCKKTLKLDCPSCKGRGKIYSEALQSYEDCSQCGGKGSFPCTECNNGYNACPSCEGKGRKPCDKCSEKGYIECVNCSGQGNTITGSQLEITKRVIEQKHELLNEAIPENILGDDLSSINYAAYKTIEIEQGQQPENLPQYVSVKLAEIESKLQLPYENRILRKSLYIEEKHVYCMSYKTVDKQNSAWFGFSADKLVIERNFIKIRVIKKVLWGLNPSDYNKIERKFLY